MGGAEAVQRPGPAADDGGALPVTGHVNPFGGGLPHVGVPHGVVPAVRVDGLHPQLDDGPDGHNPVAPDIAGVLHDVVHRSSTRTTSAGLTPGGAL